jgi:trk system potassium uptake protein
MKSLKYCVIGLGYFGYNLAIGLSEAGAEVLAIDNHQEKIDEISEKVTHAVCMDSVDKKTLLSLGIDEMDAVIIAIGGDFESSLLTTAYLQDMGIKKIYSRITSKVHERILKLMNVHEILVPEADAAEQLKNRLILPGLIESYKISKEYGVFEIPVPKKFIGKTILEASIREEYNLNIVTIKRIKRKISLPGLKSDDETKAIGVPKPDEKFEEGDILALFGRDKDIKNLIEML